MALIAQGGLGEAQSRHSAHGDPLSTRKCKPPPSADAQRVPRAAPAAAAAEHAVTECKGAVTALCTATTAVRGAVTAPRPRAPAGLPVERRGGFFGVAGGPGGLAGSRRTAAAAQRLDAELRQLFRPGPKIPLFGRAKRWMRHPESK